MPAAGCKDPRFAKSVEAFLKKRAAGYYATLEKTLTP